LLLFGNEQISCTLLLPILPNRILFCLALQSFGFLSGISPPVSCRVRPHCASPWNMIHRFLWKYKKQAARGQKLCMLALFARTFCDSGRSIVGRCFVRSCGHLFTGIQVNYQFIDQHKQEFPVVVMCRVLEVSESGFYAWRKRPICQRKREDAQLTEEIRQEFHAHHGRYGSPRLHAEWHDQGRSISRKRVTRLMSEVGLCAKRNRRRVLTTRQDPTHAVAPNTLNRDFTAPEPNKKWVGDITSIPTAQGWLYLAVILDLYSRIVVGWSMSANGDEKLAESALEMALARRRPEAGLLHHSDRGSQSTSRAYRLS
jgi:putative transposase